MMSGAVRPRSSCSPASASSARSPASILLKPTDESQPAGHKEKAPVAQASQAAVTATAAEAVSDLPQTRSELTQTRSELAEIRRELPALRDLIVSQGRTLALAATALYRPRL